MKLLLLMLSLLVSTVSFAHCGTCESGEPQGSRFTRMYKGKHKKHAHKKKKCALGCKKKCCLKKKSCKKSKCSTKKKCTKSKCSVKKACAAKKKCSTKKKCTLKKKCCSKKK